MTRSSVKFGLVGRFWSVRGLVCGEAKPSRSRIKTSPRTGAKMIKYFSTQSKKEVHFGDIITFVKSCETPFGKGQMSVDITVTKSNIDVLLKEGILYKQGSDRPNAEGKLKGAHAPQ